MAAVSRTARRFSSDTDGVTPPPWTRTRSTSVPSGKVKWFDPEKGFGFIAPSDGGEDVHVRVSALPPGVTTLKPGQKVEFGVADGRRGPQALQVQLVEAPPTIAPKHRRSA